MSNLPCVTLMFVVLVLSQMAMLYVYEWTEWLALRQYRPSEKRQVLEYLLGTRRRSMNAGNIAHLMPIEKLSKQNRNETGHIRLSTELRVSSYKDSKILPKWMKEYFAWHAEQRKRLSESNWKEHRYLIQRCLNVDRQCGGTADRLRSMPAKVRLAALTKRIFFIKWERPAKLEEFLLPPHGGLDWRVPAWLDGLLEFNQTCCDITDERKWVLDNAIASNRTILDTLSAFGQSAGAIQYNEWRENEDEPDFDAIYREFWSFLFQPSTPVQAAIEEKMAYLGLTPNLYNALHIRSQYLGDESVKTDLIENATNCGLSFGREMPLYITSDSLLSSRKALRHAAQYTRLARTAITEEEPLHLDRGREFTVGINADKRDRPDLYYPTFVDMYLLANSRCMAAGRGTYARWANLLSTNQSCYVSYFANYLWTFPAECKLKLQKLRPREM